ncbi:MAG: general secretion pathway protein GspK [Phycisphaerales bacterium]|nr:general secretion pathway protein GspK [Phycisphaerales bacterium]
MTRKTCRHSRRRMAPTTRSAFVLVVVLIVIVLLSLLAAGYSLMVRSHVDTVETRIQSYQLRMAAEAGIQLAVTILRDRQGDLSAWYNNPDELRAIPFDGADEEGVATIDKANEERTYDKTAKPIFRVSLIAPDPDDPDKVRYGFTDECARLDLNNATEQQLRRLFNDVIPQTTEDAVDINILVDSLLDWREAGDTARPNGAKDAWYGALYPPYRAKKAPFSTIEELLLVRGFEGWIVYGEDYNQNGLLDPNEDDGDLSFPPDDGDGKLFQGVARYFTIWSQEANASADGRPRIFLNLQDLEKLQEDLEEEFDSDIVSYIIDVRSSGKTFNSVMNLLPAPPPPETDETENENTTPAQSEDSDATSQPADENEEMTPEELADQIAGIQASENISTAPPSYANLTEEEPPGTIEDLPLILDRLTVLPTPIFQGRINVSTAPRPVLRGLTDLSDEEIDAIIASRKELSPAERSSPAWLLANGVLDENRFRQILDKVTTKASMYRIESVGYADHLGVIERILVILQMRGPIPQVIYYRNLNALGPAYTPHGDETRGLRAGGAGSSN